MDKIATSITNSTVSGIVKLINEYQISRENIVSLIKDGGQYILIYYK